MLSVPLWIVWYDGTNLGILQEKFYFIDRMVWLIDEIRIDRAFDRS
jgi:hypothetical protein